MLKIGVVAPDRFAKLDVAPLPPIHSGAFLPVRPDSLRNAILVESTMAIAFLGAPAAALSEN